jgi:carbonic anhydrase/acetyltransferase-like protein (isoleucine patch superfamily)
MKPLAYIDPTATVDATATVGRGTKVWGNAYIGPGAVVGEDCMIGRTVEVGAGVTIGDRCKLEAGCQVHPGWTLADEVFVGPCAVFCNDNAPQAVRPTDAPFVPLQGRVDAGAVICANCTIIGGLTIGAGAKVWPGATVTGDVPAAYSARTPVAENRERSRAMPTWGHATLDQYGLPHGVKVEVVEETFQDGARIRLVCGGSPVSNKGTAVSTCSLQSEWTGRSVDTHAGWPERVLWGSYEQRLANAREYFARVASRVNADRGIST